MSDSSEVDQATPAESIFFQKVHSMINNESHTGSVGWTPDGTGFVICSKEAFCGNILPAYFGQAKYTSFTRRLKRWGFKRNVTGSYHNDNFHRDMVFDDDDFEAEHPTSMNNIDVANTQVCRGPPKKRINWTPPLSPSSFGDHRLSRQGSPSAKISDVEVMPDIMRTINRLKRKEKKDEDREAVFRPTKKTAYQSSATKRAITLEPGLEAAQTLALLGQQGFPQQDYLDRLAANTCRRQESLNRLAANSSLMEDVDLSHQPYKGYASPERGMMSPQSKMRQMKRCGYSIPGYWTDGASDFHSLLHLSKNENNSSLIEDFLRSPPQYNGCIRRGMVNPHSRLRQLKRGGYSVPSYWTGGDSDCHSLLHLSKNENSNSPRGLCQLTSDSTRVSIRDPGAHSRHLIDQISW